MRYDDNNEKCKICFRSSMLRWDYFEFIKGVCLLCDLMGMRARIQVLEMVAHES